MFTNFPTSLDSFTTKVVGDTLQPADVNDLQTDVIAVETKIGTGASTPTANKVLRSGGTGASVWGQVVEADQLLADNTTNDVSTSKHGYAPKGDGSTSKFLNANGAYSTPSSSFSPYVLLTTDFSVSAKFDQALSGGTLTYATDLAFATTATANRYSSLRWLLGPGGSTQVFNGSPEFTFNLYIETVPASANQGQALLALGEQGSLSGTAFTFTNRHIGWKLLSTGTSQYSLYATQADNTTENASSALTTVVDTDYLELCIKVNGSSSVDYYWRKNGGAWSSATNLTSNMPTITQSIQSIQFAINNQNTNNENKIRLSQASYKR